MNAIPRALQRLLELAPVCLRVAEPRQPYRVNYISPYVHELLGYEPQQVQGEVSFWIDQIHPDDRAAVLNSLARLAQSQTLTLDYRFRHADGQYRRLYDRVCRVEPEQAGTEVLLGVIQDQTEQRRIEMALAESEARFRRFAEQVPEVITRWEVLPQLRCVYMSPAVQALTGYAPEDFYNDPALPQKLIAPEDWQELQTLLARPAPLPSPLQLRLVCKRGAVRWVETRLAIEQDGTGHIRAVEGIVHDVTEHVLLRQSLEQTNRELERRVSERTRTLAREVEVRRQIEAELRQSQAYYEALVEAMPDALLVLDAAGNIRHFRPGRGCPLAEWDRPLVGMPMREILPSAQIDPAMKQVAAVLAGGKAEVFEFALSVGGRERHFEARLALLGTDQVLAIVRDKTAERLRARQLQQVQAELAHVLRLSTLGEMAAGLAHELNQPLTSVSSFARACIHRLRRTPPEVQKAIMLAEQVCTQAAHAGEVIRRLRRFVARREPHLSSACLNEMVLEALRLMEAEFRNAGVEPRVELEQPLPMVMADRIQIIQVVLNLLRNAVESLAAVPAEARLLVVQTKSAGAHAVEVVVADSGPGIAPEIQAHLFKPFHTTKAQGLGLGLAISRSIIEAHDGRIWATERPAGGAELHFTLPLTC